MLRSRSPFLQPFYKSEAAAHSGYSALFLAPHVWNRSTIIGKDLKVAFSDLGQPKDSDIGRYDMICLAYSEGEPSRFWWLNDVCHERTTLQTFQNEHRGSIGQSQR